MSDHRGDVFRLQPDALGDTSGFPLRTGADEPVLDRQKVLLGAAEPGEHAGCGWNEDEAVGIPGRPVGQMLSQKGREREAGKIVVGERRVADAAGEQHVLR